MRPSNFWLWIALLVVILAAPLVAQETVAGSSGSEELRLEFNQELYSRLRVEGKLLAGFEPSEYLRTPGGEITEFQLLDTATEPFQDEIGRGKRTVIAGDSEEGVRKTVTAITYEEFPSFVILEVSYQNRGSLVIDVTEWVNHGLRYELSTPNQEVWSFQGASYEDRYDWVRPLQPGGGEDNDMGMNSTDYGGGVPVIDAWTREQGLATGLFELKPRLVRLPLDRSPDGRSIGMEVVKDCAQRLAPGDTLKTYKTFIALHKGDFYNVLAPYRKMLAAAGLAYADYPDSSYQPVWCGWGYQRAVSVEQMLGTLEKARDLGFRWAVLDDGWQVAEGDWQPIGTKFPGGDQDMRAFTQAVRTRGLRPKLWWAPLAADPGSELLREHPDYLLLNQEGKPQKITWWDAYYLCPDYAPVRRYTRALVTQMLQNWDFDGLKIDGQHLNAAPPCHNPAHRHSTPEVSFEETPEFLKAIYDRALELKPDAVVEVCPCGTTYALHSLPFTNQPVSSDPESSFQIRLKAKTLKALMGASVPYYGDHVELSDGGGDYASTLGVGGVLGSKFTLSQLNSQPSKTDLTPEKELEWKRWTEIYAQHELPRGKYLGDLYDIGFDRPETHVIAKGDTRYFAFYADQHRGSLELRGLSPTVRYHLRDYVRDRSFGTVHGPEPRIEASFQGYLLIEAVPVD